MLIIKLLYEARGELPRGTLNPDLHMPTSSHEPLTMIEGRVSTVRSAISGQSYQIPLYGVSVADRDQSMGLSGCGEWAPSSHAFLA